MAIRPDGSETAVKAPDAGTVPEHLSPYTWSQADREKGSFRRPLGGKSYESAVAVVGPDGKMLDDQLEVKLDDLLFVMTSMYNGMILAGVIAGDLIEI